MAMSKALLILLSLLLSFSNLGCRPKEQPPEPPKAWDRFDLVYQRPTVDFNPPTMGKRKPWNRIYGYLGTREVRNRNRIAPFYFERIPQIGSSQIFALEQAVGSRLRWTVDLGRQPFLSFIPLGNENNPLATFYRVTIRQANGESQVLCNLEAPLTIPPAPPTKTISLSSFANSTVDLVFEIIPPEGDTDYHPRSRSIWGSPAIYSRKDIPRTSVATAQRPNILLIGADTLRADALGAYGATPSVTPALDRMAAQGDVWLNAVSPFNVTNPSFVSIMTGLYGKNHGVYDMLTPLPPEHTTLAEVFSEAGYETVAILSANHLRDEGSGLGQGFDKVQLSPSHDAAELAVARLMTWLSLHPEKPFFAWLHLFDVHTPNTPPAPYARGFYPERAVGLRPPTKWVPFRKPGLRRFRNHAFGGEIDLYRGEVAYLDRQVDRLLDFLKSRGLLENTIIAFVADHGENLEDHGVLFAHHGLWQTTTHVPLIIRWPGGIAPRGRRFEGLVQSIDLFPTLIAAAGLPVPPQDGEDLRQLTGGSRRGRRAAFSENAHQWGTRVRTLRHSYMVSLDNPYFEDGRYLFDLEKDPQELHNLAGTGMPEEDELDLALKNWLSDRRKSVQTHPTDLSQEQIDRLRALGYL